MAESILYLVRHGQTFFNLENRLGGDSELTPEGLAHAQKIAEYLSHIKLDTIYSSLLKRSVQTAKAIRKSHSNAYLIAVPELAEISAGDLDSVTYEEFEQRFPELFEARNKDKYNWASPNGESYKTAGKRIMPFLDKLKSKEGNFVFAGHQGINRVILGLLLDLSEEQIPYLAIPHDTIFEINLKDLKNIYHIKEGNRAEGYLADNSINKK